MAGGEVSGFQAFYLGGVELASSFGKYDDVAEQRSSVADSAIADILESGVFGVDTGGGDVPVVPLAGFLVEFGHPGGGETDTASLLFDFG